MLSGSQSSYLHQQSQNQGDLLTSIGPRNSQGPGSQQASEPVISAPMHLPRVHGFPHDPYGSTSRAHLHHQQHYHQQLQPQQFQGPLPKQSPMQFPAEHFPRPQGEPISVMMHAHQLVDMLTEENRMLRQEMDVCREKITKLHKVNPFAQMFLSFSWEQGIGIFGVAQSCAQTKYRTYPCVQGSSSHQSIESTYQKISSRSSIILISS